MDLMLVQTAEESARDGSVEGSVQIVADCGCDAVISPSGKERADKGELTTSCFACHGTDPLSVLADMLNPDSVLHILPGAKEELRKHFGDEVVDNWFNTYPVKEIEIE